MTNSKTINDIDTPLMNQYREIKKRHTDSILFFRLGDFYEMFDEDAILASKILGIMLTKRHDVPMCGVPYHSAVNYISKLIKSGYKVAICEQVGEEDKKTKLFKREVIRIITPGTLIEESLLNSKSANYLASIVFDTVGWAVSWIDPSSGEFWALNKIGRIDISSFDSIIARINPSEIITDEKTKNYLNEFGIKLNKTPNILKDISQIHESWMENSVWKNNTLAKKAAIMCISYLKKVQPSLVTNPIPSYFNDEKNLKMDETAIKTLELIEPQYEEGVSLADVVDFSSTSMGSRTIRKWLINPLTDYYMIKKRLEEVNFLYKNPELLEKLSTILKDIPDIERIYGRIVNLTINPSDCLALKKAISKIRDITSIIQNELYDCFGEFKVEIQKYEELKEVENTINSAINEDSSLKVGEGDLFKNGWNQDYDELKKILLDTQNIIRQIELKEKEATQIPSLKIGYNSTFGYYIEITKSHLSKVPSHYIRKQTLTSGERFITEELKSLEEKILSAGEKIKKLEIYLFNEIKKLILEKSQLINSYASLLGYIDAICSFAWAAIKNNYVMPDITTENILEIEEGRHPVVEKLLKEGEFVPNDIKLNSNLRTLIITGPNMSGKSVYLRQNAICVIMAQAGSFIPAKSARIGIVDRIMTRIGAFDRLTRGESTFMVEMKETSQILKLASERSLILLDEVGRGTSTFDGISIAYAVIEYIHTKIKAKTLFATHFFEITEIASKYDGIKNV
ncbi:MAG: DNA mismatch repair protein MutS, partial [Elusimicrobiales bacterium]|nr:DNA mismatch repair protein MutS [Elusimicrobiales bacterium]